MQSRALPSGWRWATLGEVAAREPRAIVSGPFGSNIGRRFFVEEGVPVIRGNNLTTDLTRFIDSGFVFVTEAKARELGHCDAIPDDLVFTAAGSLGQVGLIPADSRFACYVISNKQLRARLDPDQVDPLFAFYWFSSPPMIVYINQRNTGSTIPLINLSVLRSLPIPVPPLAEQRAIARILGSLDDKIELNRRMNETLGAIARALFKSWFVDCDPVRAKAEGRDTGLPSDIADLFPDSFEESELGEIPTGWEEATLTDVASLNPESWSAQNRPDIIAYVDLSNTKWGEIESTASFSKEEAPSRAQRVLRTGDTIVGTVRPGNGSYALIAEEGLTGSTGFAVLRPRVCELTEFVYLAATSEESIRRLSHLADGAAYPAVRPDVVLATRVVWPGDLITSCFSQVAYPLLRRTELCRRESRTLSGIRDALLPRLVWGDLRVLGEEPASPEGDR